MRRHTRSPNGVRMIRGREYLLAGALEDRDLANAEAATLADRWDQVLVRTARHGPNPIRIWVHGQKTTPTPGQGPPPAVGRRGRPPKLSAADQAAVRRLYHAGPQTAAQIARMFRVSETTIHAVLKRPETAP